MYRANQKFYISSSEHVHDLGPMMGGELTTNQFVAVVIDVALPRMLILKISGGYTQATHAQVMANMAT
jgi:hypothetical protein